MLTNIFHLIIVILSRKLLHQLQARSFLEGKRYNLGSRINVQSGAFSDYIKWLHLIGRYWQIQIFPLLFCSVALVLSGRLLVVEVAKKVTLLAICITLDLLHGVKHFFEDFKFFILGCDILLLWGVVYLFFKELYVFKPQFFHGLRIRRAIGFVFTFILFLWRIFFLLCNVLFN